MPSPPDRTVFWVVEDGPDDGVDARTDERGAARTHRRAGWLVAGGVALAVTLVIGAIAGGWLWGGYVPRDEQQAEPCDGLPAVDSAALRLLDPDATVRSGVICVDSVRLRPGFGRWTVREVHDIPAAALPRLVEALARPDRNGGGSCTDELILVPGFVLTLDDGTRIRPGLPGDGCHVYSGVSFDALSTGPVRTSTPVKQLLTEQEVVTGCQPESSPPTVWLDSPSTFPVSTVDPITPGARPLSLCRYSAGETGNGDDGQVAEGSLTLAGTVSADEVNAALTGLSESPSPQCSESLAQGTSPRTDWLLVQSAPLDINDDQEPAAPLLAIETDGCRRVVDTQKRTLLGYLPPDGTLTLTETAARPTS